jgi:cardiolipin synthase (CMP-forming)
LNEKIKPQGLTLANRITIARLLLIPPFLIALLDRGYGLALALGFAMAASDTLDGFVARRYRQRTRLGSFLDPLADKLLLLSTYVAFAHLGVAPEWVLVIVVAKDVLVSLGWLLSFVLLGSSEVMTRFSGKAATASQMAYACLVLFTQAFSLSGPIWTAAASFFQCVMVALTVLSLLDYLRLGSRRFARI